MAKKRAKALSPADEHEQNGPADGRSDLRDSIQAALRKTLAKQEGAPTLLTNKEALARAGGIALPSLCLRYLFHQDTLPLGRILTLSGLFRSNKTALAFEISSWIMQHQGLGWYNNAEERDSPGMRSAIFRHDEELINSMQILECSTQEQWQGSVTHQLNTIMNATKGVMIVPGVSIVDSIAAAPPKGEAANFIKDKGGAGARGFATIALLNSNWLTQITHRVNDGPFLLLLIQHSSEKPAEGLYGQPIRTQKGGMEVGFAKTMALEMTRVKDLKETDSGGGALINIECTKNSLGPTKRHIRVNCRWWWEEDPDGGDPKQQYVWDWHEASMSLLLSMETMPGRSATWKKLKEICDLHGESRQRVWSKALGIPSSSPVSYREAMEVLEYDHPELLPPIYNLFHISRQPILLPGADLAQIWNGTVGIPDVAPPLPYRREPILGAGFADEE